LWLETAGKGLERANLLLLLPMNKHNKALFLIVEKKLANAASAQLMVKIEDQHKTSHNNYSIAQRRK
jgi:hypothetical protein